MKNATKFVPDAFYYIYSVLNLLMYQRVKVKTINNFLFLIFISEMNT